MIVKPKRNNPLFLTVSVFSSLFGFSGIEHSLFEILQGNTSPNSLLISAIGPSQRFWEYGTETAFTIIPNFLITGIVAMAFSILVIVWSIFFLKNKYSWIFLLFLSVVQFLTGGGFAQIFLSVIISFAASGLYSNHNIWKKYISDKIKHIIAAFWIFFFTLFILLFLCSMGIAIFGIPFGNFDPSLAFGLMTYASYIMIIVFIVTIITAYAKESLIEYK